MQPGIEELLGFLRCHYLTFWSGTFQSSPYVDWRFSVVVYQGWGMTETTAAGIMNGQLMWTILSGC